MDTILEGSLLLLVLSREVAQREGNRSSANRSHKGRFRMRQDRTPPCNSSKPDPLPGLHVNFPRAFPSKRALSSLLGRSMLTSAGASSILKQKKLQPEAGMWCYGIFASDKGVKIVTEKMNVLGIHFQQNRDISSTNSPNPFKSHNPSARERVIATSLARQGKNSSTFASCCCRPAQQPTFSPGNVPVPLVAEQQTEIQQVMALKYCNCILRKATPTALRLVTQLFKSSNLT